MVNHSLIKLVLFMAAGVVFMNLHKLNLNEIRGFGRKKPLLNACFLMGALGIGGVPLWNGYTSKTLLHESIVEYRLLLASANAGVPAGGAMRPRLWQSFPVQELQAVRRRAVCFPSLQALYGWGLWNGSFNQRRADCGLYAEAVYLPVSGEEC